MIELDATIKNALIKMDFVKRYEELSSKFNSERTPDNKRLEYVDGEEIMEIIHNFGYVPLFNKKEKFFKIKEEEIDEFSFGVHIILRYGAVEIIWVVRRNDILLLGDPWATYSRKLIEPQYRIKKPIFGSYEDLDQIFEVTFKMYEDFKKAVTEK